MDQDMRRCNLMMADRYDGASGQADIYVMATRLVALRIRELCFMNGITLPELASRAGMPVSSIRDIVNGKNRDMRLSSLVRIAAGLNTDLAYFFDTDFFEAIMPVSTRCL